MRKSKSDPAKYARNYRKISQRRMTEREENGESAEEDIKRLRELLRTSTAHLSRYDEATKEQEVAQKKKKETKRKREVDGDDEKESSKTNTDITNAESTSDNEEVHYTTDKTELILPSRKKNTGTKKKRVELTPEELKAAKKRHKEMQRKLNQIESRHLQKKRRQELYNTLSEHAISERERSLLGKSSEVGKRVSKREMLRRLIQRERAGISLTADEKALLYTEMSINDNAADFNADHPNFGKSFENNEEANDSQSQIETADKIDESEIIPLAFPSTGKKKKKSKKKNPNVKDMPNTENHKCTSIDIGINDIIKDASMEDRDDEIMNNMTIENASKEVEHECKQSKEDVEEEPPVPESNIQSLSFAEQMMAGLSSLKTKAAIEKDEMDKKVAIENAAIAEEKRLQEEEERKKRKMYVPPTPTIPQTAARMGLRPAEGQKNNWRVLSLKRPQEIEEKRYDLPVSKMEYEIMDSIRNHTVTILCSETGSGKSTQVPQFLYESGVTLGNALQGEDDGLLVGVTQPRRVAAVSTAKRVCYEMGHSNDNGQSIKGKRGEGNLVAYHTKYESAGLGSKTRVKFMTDGILLQEIKKDLMLRKYSVICLDEAHERNLNTDVLIGLLSVALPLREKAAKERSLPPLKLVIMSATLRVEDFSSNDKLFPQNQPNLIKVPGRTFPVTIHHSKVTEVDDYEKVAFQKVCKIHHKLPPGGILVFLTGKQEIVRMVNRLRLSLQKEKDMIEVSMDVDIVGENENDDFEAGFRDMDDEEADGDLFQQDDNDNDLLEESTDEYKAHVSDTEDNIPKKVIILPLYSLLSVKEQAKVFAPVEEGTRLIVVATNVAETSLTIPGMSYVVDSGRQKCRNFHAGTGIASYDVMWISKASADQRAGRAGRTGPGHCYRLFSSSVYARHLDPFALPEVLTRPLEDVVLAMKAMNIRNVADFPFPTAPDPSQLGAAVKLLANIGCIDVSSIEREGGDGAITSLGSAVSMLPLGVRYGKMLLVSAHANVLDYGIILVSILSEASPFRKAHIEKSDNGDSDTDDNSDEDSLAGLDDIDRNNAIKQDRKKEKDLRKMRWQHDGGDALAGMLAVGAYSYAGRGAGGKTEKMASKKFCEENGLEPVIMERVQKMRTHLAHLSKQRLHKAGGVAASTGKFLSNMPPPNKLQERILMQTIASGLLDNVARRTTMQGRLGNNATVPRSAFFCCRNSVTEPLFIDKNSIIFSRDPRKLPEWVCYDSIIRKTTKDGSTISTMHNVTPLDPQWLGAIGDGSHLLSLGEPLDTPVPKYDLDRDAIMCSVRTKFGDHGWLLPPLQIEMEKVLHDNSKKTSSIMSDDPYRWFARYLIEGKVFKELQILPMLNDSPSIITRKKPVKKVAILVSSLSSNGIDSASKLVEHWREKNETFLFKCLKSWTKKEKAKELKHIWMNFVKQQVAV